MTQILSGICSEGIMVATDSMATSFDEDGKENHFTVDKLFSIGSHAFIVSGGMGISVELSMRFKRYAEERKLVGIEEIKSLMQMLYFSWNDAPCHFQYQKGH